MWEAGGSRTVNRIIVMGETICHIIKVMLQLTLLACKMAFDPFMLHVNVLQLL
jgi:hypothetical protein